MVYFWDLDDYEFIGSEDIHQNVIFSLRVYYRDSKPYLVSTGVEYGSDGEEEDEEVGIWIYDLEKFRPVKKLVTNDDFSHFWLVTNQLDEQIVFAQVAGTLNHFRAHLVTFGYKCLLSPPY